MTLEGKCLIIKRLGLKVYKGEKYCVMCVSTMNCPFKGINYTKKNNLKMRIIIRNRTIRPSSRKADSAYRVKVENAKPEDQIIIIIDHESMDYRSVYKCSGELFQKTDSIHFKVKMSNDQPIIDWGNDRVLEKIK